MPSTGDPRRSSPHAPEPGSAGGSGADTGRVAFLRSTGSGASAAGFSAWAVPSLPTAGRAVRGAAAAVAVLAADARLTPRASAAEAVTGGGALAHDHRDVALAGSGLHGRLAEAHQVGPRDGADDAVGLQALPGLEVTHGALGRGAVDAVGRQAQARLDGLDRRARAARPEEGPGGGVDVAARGVGPRPGRGPARGDGGKHLARRSRQHQRAQRSRCAAAAVLPAARLGDDRALLARLGQGLLPMVEFGEVSRSGDHGTAAPLPRRLRG